MEEYLNIRTLLINGSIDYKEAFERIKKLPKAWTTQHWREMRKVHLKDKCENCGSAEPPLVIQHTKQPTGFSIFYNKIMNEYINFERTKSEVIKKHVTEKIVNKYLKENSQIRDACPLCGITSIRLNKKLNVYTCQKNHTFEIPSKINYYTKTRTTDFEKAKDSAVSFLTYTYVSKKIKEMREEYDLEVGKQALLLSFVEGIEYRQFKNIKTCCKRCAAIEDKIVPEYVLCVKCKVAYHNPIYKTCLNCKDV